MRDLVRSRGLGDVSKRQLLPRLEGHRAGVNDVAFSADGATLYTASTDGELRSRNVADGALSRADASHGFGGHGSTLDPHGAWSA